MPKVGSTNLIDFGVGERKADLSVCPSFVDCAKLIAQVASRLRELEPF